jgi:hypothetical protein
VSYEVFISHSSKDKVLAAEICAYLEANRVRCWIAPRDIKPGPDWAGSIVDALDECPVVVVLLTENANASRQVVKEVERADSKGATIIAFRAEPVKLNKSLEYFLSSRHRLDASSRPTEPHLATLLAAVNDGIGKRSRERTVLPVAERSARASEARAGLAREFKELSPDDWGARPRNRVGQFFSALLSE